jgi:hypothetical protein
VLEIGVRLALAARWEGNVMKMLHMWGALSSGFGKRIPLDARASLLAVAIVLSGTVAAADPVRPISAGAVFTGGDDTGFSIFGPDLSLSASRVLDPIVNCAPCAPGADVNLSTALHVSDWIGRATVDGETYESVYFNGVFNFTAGSVIVPDMPPGQSGPDNEGLSQELTRFAFAGTLSGFADPGRAGAPLFSSDLSGGGEVVVRFSNYPMTSGIRVAELNYAFQSVAATPEPGSLLLLGSGGAWVAARARARRRC